MDPLCGRAGDDERTLKPQNYIDPTQRPLPLWGKRADRAYINAVETFAPFAALVIVAIWPARPTR